MCILLYNFSFLSQKTQVYQLSLQPQTKFPAWEEDSFYLSQYITMNLFSSHIPHMLGNWVQSTE